MFCTLPCWEQGINWLKILPKELGTNTFTSLKTILYVLFLFKAIEYRRRKIIFTDLLLSLESRDRLWYRPYLNIGKEIQALHRLRQESLPLGGVQRVPLWPYSNHDLTIELVDHGTKRLWLLRAHMFPFLAPDTQDLTMSCLNSFIPFSINPVGNLTSSILPRAHHVPADNTRARGAKGCLFLWGCGWSLDTRARAFTWAHKTPFTLQQWR